MNNSLPGPKTILRKQLANGIKILSAENPSSPSLVLSGLIPGGMLVDPELKDGLGLMLAAAMMRGTEHTPFDQLHEKIEGLGASLSFSAGIHAFSFRARMLTEDLPTMLALLLEVLRFPVFPEQHLNQIRDQFLAGLSIRDQDTEAMAELAFDKALFGAHPYARDRHGTVESLRSVTRLDMIRHHEKFFHPDGMILSLVGGVEPNAAIESVERFFMEWHSEPKTLQVDSPVTVTPPERSQRVHVEIAEKSQMDLIMGTTGPDRKSAHYLPAAIGNSILGEFGMMGRIGEIVREEEGLAYYAGSSLNPLPLGGSWEISAGSSPEDVDQVIELVEQEIHRFTAELVSVEELDDVKSSFKGRLPLQLESNGGVAEWLLTMEHFDLGLDYLQKYPARVMEITRENVLETARSFLNPDRLIIATAGTRKALR